MLYSGKDLRKLIIPLIIEQILAIAVGMADTIMVSAAGEAAVSGVSLVDTVNIFADQCVLCSGNRRCSRFRTFPWEKEKRGRM